MIQRGLGEAAQVVAPEDVAEDPDQQHQPDDPEEEDHRAPEQAEERVVVPKHQVAFRRSMTHWCAPGPTELSARRTSIESQQWR